MAYKQYLHLDKQVQPFWLNHGVKRLFIYAYEHAFASHMGHRLGGCMRAFWSQYSLLHMVAANGHILGYNFASDDPWQITEGSQSVEDEVCRNIDIVKQ